MWPFKKKYPAAAKYKMKDFVDFYHRGEMRFAWIYDAKIDSGLHLRVFCLGFR